MRKNLRILLEKYVPEATVIFEASGVQAGLEALNRQPPDLLFLDVEMKDGTGFDILAQYGEVDFHTVFVTGHDRYAIKAFKYSAIDYLLKPVAPADLREAVDKVLARDGTQQQSSMSTLIDNQDLQSLEKKIILRDKDSIFVVRLKDIVRCESINNYTLFYLDDGRKLMITNTLKDYEKLFDDLPFFRSHRSHLINLNYIDRFDKSEGGVVYFKDGSTAPVSSRKKDLFIERLSQL